MKLAEALTALNQARAAGPELGVFLACGFEALHLRTFLAAHLLQRMPDRRVRVETGQFGDLAGNVGRAARSACDVVVVCVEWADLEPRLDLRRLGGWRPGVMEELAGGVEAATRALLASVVAAAQQRPVVLSLPTLPLPPLSTHGRARTDVVEARLHRIVAELREAAATVASVRVLNAESLDELSPPAGRLDVRAALSTGLPYSLPHASALAARLAQVAYPPPPRKGLITDLDGTFWRGILGEDGPEAVCWDLEGRAQIHGLYQQTLAALAQAGVLIGIASKNDPELTRQALARKDLVLAADRIFPVDAGWGLKSDAVARTLAAWNVGPESVVFVDDSPWEIAEVGRMFPAMTCLLFPADDPQAAYQLLRELRDLFGKDAIFPEDRIRTESLRGAPRRPEPRSEGAIESMLRDSRAELCFSTRLEPADGRALELINKTNQFNLNGRRLAAAELEARSRRPGAIFLMGSYADRFGALGRVLVLLGQARETEILVDTWVMSCRAFGRRIEHATLEYLFERFGGRDLVFDFERTPRNGPLAELLDTLGDAEGAAAVRLTAERFRAMRPSLFHAVSEAA